MNGAPQPVHLSVKIEGVVLPIWLAGALLVCGIAAAVCLATAVYVVHDARRELRILQLHTSDMEAVFIRSGLAERSDFAAWHDGSAPAAARPSDADHGAPRRPFESDPQAPPRPEQQQFREPNK